MSTARPRSISAIYVRGFLVVAAIALAVTIIVIVIEYHNFNVRAETLRKQYLHEQKERIRFDTDRVLRYIASEYRAHHTRINDAMLQRQILSAIAKLYGRPDGTGYIFVYNFDGVCLGDPVQPQNIGKNLYHFRDPDGVQVIRELIEESRRHGGGFVRYTWIKPTTKERSPKISYARAFEPWRWMVGTGVYLDEVDRVIAARRRSLEERMIRNLIKLALLLVLLYGLGLAGMRIINRTLRRETESFERFFAQAAREHVRIDPRQVRLEEFRQLAEHVNTMVETIHERKQRLKAINASLEEQVARQTAHLRERNKQLAHEKELNEALVVAQDRFIRSAIHEINTPLAVIMTHIDIYKMHHGTNRYLAKIEAGAKMIATLFDDLSYMVKRQRFEYTPAWIDLSEMVAQRIRFFDEIASGNGHRIHATIAPDVLIWFSDVLMQRIIDNNLSNAIKYAQEHSTIDVRLQRQGSDAVVLTFINHSRGTLDTTQIFDPFHRGENNSHTEHDGFGLGLAIVRQICDDNGVEISVTSDSNITSFSYLFTLREDLDAHTAA